jgi:hypothetical protein
MATLVPELATEVAGRISAIARVPIAVCDGDGNIVARIGAERGFCPLVFHGEPGAPLPRRCATCARVHDLRAGRGDDLAPCPYGVDAVRPISVGGAPAGWVATAVMPKEMADAVEGAAKLLDVATAPLAAAVAAANREEAERDLVARKLDVARCRMERAFARLPFDSPARAEMELARDALARACDVLEAGAPARRKPGRRKPRCGPAD